MNKLCTPILIFFLFTTSLFSQLHNWPPDALVPAKAFAKYKFKSGKFIPSTKRWNLVWGDQLAPGYSINEKQTEFVAKNYVATQKIWSNQLESFEKYNPNFLCVIYHLALGINPEDNSECPDPKSMSNGFIGSIAPKGYINEYTDYFKPWLAKNNIAIGSYSFENMFQHYDSVTKNKRVWHKDPQWVTNGADSNWRKYIAGTCIDWMDGNRNEGCFFDVSIETNVPGMHYPNQWAPEPVNFEWWMVPHFPTNWGNPINDRREFGVFQNYIFKSYYQYIYRQFHNGTNDYLVIPNVDQMITTVYDPVWLDGDSGGETIDGAMIENFGNATGGDMYLSLERGLRHITGRNKILIAQGYPNDTKEVLRMVAEYMLIKNESSFINIMMGSGPQWYPEYEIDLGKQEKVPDSLSKLRIKGSGSQSLWKREYEHGIVLCNTSNQTMDYNPYGDNWFYLKTSGGGPVNENGEIMPQNIEKVKFTGSITVQPSDCMILVKDTASAIESGEYLPEFNFDIHPNPASHDLTINYELFQAGIVKISIINQLGQEVATVEEGYKDAGKESIQVSLNEMKLESGIYFVVFKTEKNVKMGKITLVR